MTKKSMEERFWEKVKVGGEDECWEWQAATTSEGYGNFWLEGKDESAHRVVWSLTNGEIPNGLWVLHKCDNRACVNLNHLFLGTSQDNVQDRVRKDRNKNQNGELSSNSRLTTTQVLEIRKLYIFNNIPQSRLAKTFNVTRAHISNIIRRKRWAHLP